MSSKQKKNRIHLPMDLVLDPTPDPWNKGRCRRAPQTNWPTHDGQDDIDVCLVPFARIAERYASSEVEKINRLYESLKDKAMWYVCSLPRAMTANYRSMRKSLTKRFDLPLCA